MTQKMIINAVDPDEVRIAILNERTLVDFDIESHNLEKNKGNIYLGVVMAVEPALGAAFVNYGQEKQGFLTANDVHPKYAPEPFLGKNPTIDKLLKPRQKLLVQVSKDEVGQKGAVLTTFLSLAGRYLVLMPDSETHGISRKIDDDETRNQVREAAAKLDVPANMGVIIRTAGQDRTKADLSRDLRVLLRLWENIQKQAAEATAPSLIFKEQDVIIRALRDYFANAIDEIVLDSDEAYDRAAEYMHLVMPNHRSVLTRYVERRPIFHHYRIEEQLAAIFMPKVVLPSGGSIVLESTEALVAVDVNSGKQKSSNQEETALQTNLEAAHEVGRQLRLRDLGGIIVIDFIDMILRKNQQRVERAVKEALLDDKAKIKIGRISRNGTLEITRQRLRSALQASVFVSCQACQGTGQVLNPRSQVRAVLRELGDRAAHNDLKHAVVRALPQVCHLLQNESLPALEVLQKTFNFTAEIIADPQLHAGNSDFTFVTNPEVIPLPFIEPNFGPAPRHEDDDGTEPDAGDHDEPQKLTPTSNQLHNEVESSEDLLQLTDPEFADSSLALPNYQFISSTYINKLVGKTTSTQRSRTTTTHSGYPERRQSERPRQPGRSSSNLASRMKERKPAHSRPTARLAAAPRNTYNARRSQRVGAETGQPQQTNEVNQAPETGLLERVWRWFQGS